MIKVTYPEKVFELTKKTEELLKRLVLQFGNLNHIRIQEVYGEVQKLKKSYATASDAGNDKQTSEKVLTSIAQKIAERESHLIWLLETELSPK